MSTGLIDGLVEILAIQRDRNCDMAKAIRIHRIQWRRAMRRIRGEAEAAAEPDRVVVPFHRPEID